MYKPKALRLGFVKPAEMGFSPGDTGEGKAWYSFVATSNFLNVEMGGNKYLLITAIHFKQFCFLDGFTNFLQ